MYENEEALSYYVYLLCEQLNNNNKHTRYTRGKSLPGAHFRAKTVSSWQRAPSLVQVSNQVKCGFQLPPKQF